MKASGLDCFLLGEGFQSTRDTFSKKVVLSEIIFFTPEAFSVIQRFFCRYANQRKSKTWSFFKLSAQNFLMSTNSPPPSHLRCLKTAKHLLEGKVTGANDCVFSFFDLFILSSFWFQHYSPLYSDVCKIGNKSIAQSSKKAAWKRQYRNPKLWIKRKKLRLERKEQKGRRNSRYAIILGRIILSFKKRREGELFA